MASEARPTTDSGTGFQPYIPDGTTMHECTLRAIILGALLGMVFGASSLYLVLKVGLTVSASIPVAVISLALFRLWSKAGGRDATILENNIVQTAGSAGESIAFGLGVTMPAIMILGFDLEIGRVMLVGLLGGLLGILMMIPLRRALIVAQHGQLKYPEGTACAQVLIAGAAGKSARKRRGRSTRGANGPLAVSGPRLSSPASGLVWPTRRSWPLLGSGRMCRRRCSAPRSRAAQSPRKSPPNCWAWATSSVRGSASIMMAGGVLSCLVLTPLIKFFGAGLNVVLPPGHQADRRHESGRHPQRLHPLYRRGSGRGWRHH